MAPETHGFGFFPCRSSSHFEIKQVPMRGSSHRVDLYPNRILLLTSRKILILIILGVRHRLSINGDILRRRNGSLWAMSGNVFHSFAISRENW